MLSFPAKEGAVATQAYNRGDALDIGNDGLPVDVPKAVAALKRKLGKILW